MQTHLSVRLWQPVVRGEGRHPSDQDDHLAVVCDGQRDLLRARSQLKQQRRLRLVSVWNGEGGRGDTHEAFIKNGHNCVRTNYGLMVATGIWCNDVRAAPERSTPELPLREDSKGTKGRRGKGSVASILLLLLGREVGRGQQGVLGVRGQGLQRSQADIIRGGRSLKR